MHMITYIMYIKPLSLQKLKDILNLFGFDLSWNIRSTRSKKPMIVFHMPYVPHSYINSFSTLPKREVDIFYLNNFVIKYYKG